MKCPHCGAENPDNSVFCVECDKWILAGVYVLPPAAAEVNEPEAEDKKSAKKAARKIVLSTAAALCAVIFGISLLLPDPTPPLPTTTTTVPSTDSPSPDIPPTLPPTELPLLPFVQCESNMQMFDMDGSIGLIVDDAVLETNYPYTMLGNVPVTSQNGRCSAFISEGELVLVRNGQVMQIAENAEKFVLSAYGNAVAYVSDTGLTLFDVGSGAVTVIDALRDMDLNHLAISPDGGSVAYFLSSKVPATGANYERLMLYRNGDAIDLGAYVVPRSSYGGPFERTPLLGVADGGDWVYAYLDGKLQIVDAAGNLTPLGAPLCRTSNNPYMSVVMYEESLYFNADCRQVLFYQTDGTYLSIDGQPAVKLSNQYLSPIMPEMTNPYTSNGVFITAPYYDLRSPLYCSVEYTMADQGTAQDPIFFTAKVIHYLDGQLQAHAVLENLSRFWLDPSGTYLYYLLSDGTLCRMTGADGDNAVVLDTDCDAFAVRFDCSGVYTLCDQDLSYIGTDLVSQLIWSMEINTKLNMTADGTLCFWQDGMLYYLQGSELFKVESSGLIICENGSIYTKSQNGTLYQIKNGALRPIWESDLDVSFD